MKFLNCLQIYFFQNNLNLFCKLFAREFFTADMSQEKDFFRSDKIFIVNVPYVWDLNYKDTLTGPRRNKMHM